MRNKGYMHKNVLTTLYFASSICNYAHISSHKNRTISNKINELGSFTVLFGPSQGWQTSGCSSIFRGKPHHHFKTNSTLRERLGVQLFNRSNVSFELTEEGLQLQEIATR